MNKEGQFFLIAALVVVGAIFGLATIYNTVQTTEEDTTVYDLSDEINFEAAQVIDNGVFNGENIGGNVIPSRIENLTDFYSNTTKESDLIIVYGNSAGVTVLIYKKIPTGSIGINIGTTPLISMTMAGKSKNNRNYENPVTVDLGESEYNFNLRPGQVFYLVIKKEKYGERYISSPGQATGGGTPSPPQSPCGAGHQYDASTNICTARITPAVDGYIYHNGAGTYTNYNSEQDVRAEVVLPGEYRGYIEWSISTIPDISTINSVSLLYEGKQFEVHQNTAPYRWGYATYARPSQLSNSDLFSATAGLQGQNYLSINSPDFIKIGVHTVELDSNMAPADLQSQLGGDWFAISIYTTGTQRALIWSSEAEANGHTPPTLVVTYTP